MRDGSSPGTSGAPAATEALRLHLDHTGCIVNDFDGAAARWEHLGFSLTPVSRQRGAVPGKEGFHPWATANRCVILRNTYLELIGVVDAGAFNPWQKFIARNEGLHILALRCRDAEATYAALSERTDALLPPVPRERVLDADGEQRTMRFRNIFSRDEAWPEARYLVIEHQTPEYLWQPRYQAHENGACDLVAVTLVADEPPALLSRLEALGAAIVAQDADGISAKLAGRGTLHVMASKAFEATYGRSPHPGAQAIALSFRDLARAIDLFQSRGIAVNTSAHGRWIGPRDANGFVMQLVQDRAPS